MATPMITRRGGYPVRYAKPVALGVLDQVHNTPHQHRRAPFVPSPALPDLEYLGEVGSKGSAVCPSSDGRSNGVHSRCQLFANAAIAAARVAS
jgi:hypothetical protein